ncbi:uncharacterized protein JCM10292_000360 [Rhodotorula paludigena]|uniref:uncharacterized protein n=1 Tax=Rhodotorula paludigena TaxID=86838 RepID=UPI0031811185
MAAKRKAATADLDLTALDSDSSDEDFAPQPLASTSTSRTRSRALDDNDQDEEDDGFWADAGRASSGKPRYQAWAEESDFLRPRGSLFGGPGLGSPKASQGSSDSSSKGKSKASDQQAARQPVALDDVLPFALGGEPTATQSKQLAKLEHGQPSLLFTTRVKQKRGGRKKKNVASDSDDDSDNETSRVDLDTIVGKDPHGETVRAIFAAPELKMPWAVNRFATPSLSGAKRPQKDKPVSKKRRVSHSDSDDDDELSDGKGSSSKSKKASKPQLVRVYKKTDNVPLLLLHRKDLEVDPTADKVYTCQPKVARGGGLNAKFFLIVRKSSKTDRHHLRIGICTANGTDMSWTKVENAIWIKDFPALCKPFKKPADNDSHTTFSRAFLDFLDSPAFPLPYKTAFLSPFAHFDFSSSKHVQLVTSLAGRFEGTHGLIEAGGLTSLAKAMKALNPLPGGKWKVEYLSPVSESLNKGFLARLHAAVQGITPAEYHAQSTERATAAKQAFDKDSARKVVVLYPTKDEVDSRATGTAKEERHHVHWEGDAVDSLKDLPDGDMRKSLLRKAVLKSARLMLILHYPSPKEQENAPSSRCEAFLLVGSHTPSTKSWGAYAFNDTSGPPSVNIRQHELSVLYRCATASTETNLHKCVKQIVPYERPADKYDDDDEPAPTVEPKEKKRAGRPKKKKPTDDSDSE